MQRERRKKFKENIPDSKVSLPGFLAVQSIRDLKRSEKRKSGGLAVLVNNEWCHSGHTIVKYCLCCLDFELLA